MMNVWILFGALLLSGLVLLLLDAFRFKENLKASRKFDRVLKTQSRKPDNYGRWLSAIKVRMFRVSSESGTLLVQAGWDSKLNFLVWIFFARVLPGIAAVLIFMLLSATEQSIAQQVMAAVFVFSFFFVGANMVLRWRAASVARKIGKELIPFLHMLRMLFNAGLSLEHALIILVEESGQLFPHLRKQLKRVVANVGSGQDQAEALMQMARSLNIQEVTDTMSMLYQVSKYGGNIQSSLAQYIQLVEEQQLVAAREYVSKLSAKMSVVMMIFMFPALIVFIAGPGFIGLSSALGRSQF